MPKYYEDKEEDTRACSGIREDFRACLLQHDCVVKVGRFPKRRKTAIKCNVTICAIRLDSNF